jgi:hypothetical protein
MRDRRIKIGRKRTQYDQYVVNGLEEEGKKLKFFIGANSVFKSSLTLKEGNRTLVSLKDKKEKTRKGEGLQTRDISPFG